MFTHCPNCNHSQQVSRKQLKKKRGTVTCSHCKQKFNAYLTLSKTPIQSQVRDIPVTKAETEKKIPEVSTLIKVHNQSIREPETNNEPEVKLYDWQKTKTAYRPEGWLTGTILGLLLLAYQVYYFQGYLLSQNPQIRPWLNKLSPYISYSLPDYHNPLEYTTVASSFEQLDTGEYRLQVSLVNHADFSQPPPYLQLTLQDLFGGIVAQRIFSPQEYLNKTKNIMPIKSSDNLDIDFLLTIPEQDIDGYSIQLK